MKRDRRHERLLPIARWPSREEAAAMRWFQPLDAGRLQLRARTWVPAMVPWRATGEGEVTPAVLAWYRRFAEGRPGALVVEATGIRDVPSGPLLRIGHDRYLDGLRALVDTVREASGGETRLFIQLIDFLAIKRRPPKAKFLRRFLKVDAALRAGLEEHAPELAALDEPALREALVGAPDALLEAALPPRELESLRMGWRERVTDTHLPHVRDLPKTLPGLFADAAARAQAAGFDGVELHYAHAYTMASFLSAKNTREDGYGGPREQRVRLPLEVHAAVRARVGPEYVVGARFLGDEHIEGGSGLDDAVYFGRRFAEAGFDFLSVSKGGKFEDAKQPKVGQAAYPYTGPSGHECMPTAKMGVREGRSEDGLGPPGPFGRNLPLAAAIRAAIRAHGHATPLVAAGGIASPWQAEAALERGVADVVAAARQSLADPDWFRKIRLGRGDEVRRCLFTNYCEGLDQKHLAVTCQLWDRELDAPDPSGLRSADGKRRLVAPPWDPGNR
ncbi:MAG TPA: NADH:flavin oxidoreductase [Polyangiaceae bacterium LLY-WYZ-15_(1-7)]|nr:NADH:flavin oxidoreductase [Polyangiaceae bacterium LLY-WYZ-15_(1-7)]HJL08505.1 NADH:flavin oxidoreductase [Polyangiaceae bacterium LLY-WYZ-15_(1-7)]HJL39034.1 NADH:flavin oxidoreductase [Polyangiaceae bacterium LLY-WYZ-15_(1-7)]